MRFEFEFYYLNKILSSASTTFDVAMPGTGLFRQSISYNSPKLAESEYGRRFWLFPVCTFCFLMVFHSLYLIYFVISLHCFLLWFVLYWRTGLLLFLSGCINLSLCMHINCGEGWFPQHSFLVSLVFSGILTGCYSVSIFYCHLY